LVQHGTAGEALDFKFQSFLFIIIRKNLQSQKIIKPEVPGAEMLNLGGKWQANRQVQ
jgi:hypothetical protein